jgi:transcriptional regulator GlxA family with amidase domain
MTHPLIPIVLSMLLLAPSREARQASATAPTATGPRKVAIVLFPGVELLDFAGPGEVFAAARGLTGRAFDVVTVAASRAPLTSQRFLTITPTYTFEDCPAPDIVVVPGGDIPDDDLALRAWVLACSKKAEVVMSVCNGAGVLAAAGMLDGLEVTSHHGVLEHLQMLAPKANFVSNRRFVDHGRVFTAAGVSAGIDGALQVVSRLVSEESARATAAYMEYDWRPEELTKRHAEPPKRVSDAPIYGVVAALLEDGSDAARKTCVAAREASAELGAAEPTEAALNRAGYMLFGAGRHEPALAMFALVVELHPGSANAWDSLSECHERSGRPAEALSAAQKTLALLDADRSLTTEARENLRRIATERVTKLGGESDAR